MLFNESPKPLNSFQINLNPYKPISFFCFWVASPNVFTSFAFRSTKWTQLSANKANTNSWIQVKTVSTTIWHKLKVNKRGVTTASLNVAAGKYEYPIHRCVYIFHIPIYDCWWHYLHKIMGEYLCTLEFSESRHCGFAVEKITHTCAKVWLHEYI